jgi:hypothetical protein
MTKTWKRIAMGTAVVAGLAVAGALVFVPTRSAMASMKGAGMGGMMQSHMQMMQGGGMGAMMKGHMQMMQGSDMGAMHASMGAMHASMTAMHDRETAEVAALLGLSVADLDKALADGKEIGALAAERNVDPAKVTETVAAIRKATLDELVTAGTLTREQADQMLQQMESAGMMVPMGTMMPAGGHCTQAADPKTY